MIILDGANEEFEKLVRQAQKEIDDICGIPEGWLKSTFPPMTAEEVKKLIYYAEKGYG